MLQSLTNSKHKTISTCSLAALKNLYTARPTGTVSRDWDFFFLLFRGSTLKSSRLLLCAKFLFFIKDKAKTKND